MINKRNVKEFFIITIGTLIVSTAVYFFMLPSHVSVGSGTALAIADAINEADNNKYEYTYDRHSRSAKRIRKASSSFSRLWILYFCSI